MITHKRDTYNNFLTSYFLLHDAARIDYRVRMDCMREFHIFNEQRDVIC